MNIQAIVNEVSVEQIANVKRAVQAHLEVSDFRVSQFNMIAFD